jgi:hypothetical protein
MYAGDYINFLFTVILNLDLLTEDDSTILFAVRRFRRQRIRRERSLSHSSNSDGLERHFQQSSTVAGQSLLGFSKPF